MTRQCSGLLGSATPAGERLRGRSRYLDRVGEDLVRSAGHRRHVLTAP